MQCPAGSGTGRLQDNCHLIGLQDILHYVQESSGKSSLLAALSGLHLPTGSDVTTKNPVRINLKSGGAGINIKMPDGEYRPVGPQGLDKHTYQEALTSLQNRHMHDGLDNGGVWMHL